MKSNQLDSGAYLHMYKLVIPEIQRTFIFHDVTFYRVLYKNLIRDGLGSQRLKLLEWKKTP